MSDSHPGQTQYTHKTYYNFEKDHIECPHHDIHQSSNKIFSFNFFDENLIPIVYQCCHHQSREVKIFQRFICKVKKQKLGKGRGGNPMLHELDLEALYVCHGLSENSKNFDYYTILYWLTRNREYYFSLKEKHHLEKIQFWRVIGWMGEEGWFLVFISLSISPENCSHTKR